VDSNPGDQASQLRLANLLHDSGLYSRAVETYRKYLSVRPQDTNARVDLGICYFELARLDSAGSQRLLGLAIAEMEKAARDSARHQPAAFNLGIVNLYAGNTQESNRWFRRAIELNGDSDLGIRAKRLLEQHSFQSPSTN
jgi:Flp pilus assembly protein TadD